MTPADFAAQIERMVDAASDAGIDDDLIAELLADAVSALREGLS